MGYVQSWIHRSPVVVVAGDVPNTQLLWCSVCTAWLLKSLASKWSWDTPRWESIRVMLPLKGFCFCCLLTFSFKVWLLSCGNGPVNALQVRNWSEAGKSLSTADLLWSWSAWHYQLITSLLLSPASQGTKTWLNASCKVSSPRLDESFSSTAAVLMQSAIPQQPGCSYHMSTPQKQWQRERSWVWGGGEFIFKYFTWNKPELINQVSCASFLPAVLSKWCSHQQIKVLASSPEIPALGQTAFSPLLSLGLNEDGNGIYRLNMLFLHCNVGRY